MERLANLPDLPNSSPVRLQLASGDCFKLSVRRFRADTGALELASETGDDCTEPRLGDGGKAEVEVDTGGSVYRFLAVLSPRTAADGVVFAQAPLDPEDYVVVQRRAALRVDVERAVRLRGVDEPASAEVVAQLRDLSAGGVRLGLNRMVAPGRRIRLQFDLQDGREPLDCIAEAIDRLPSSDARFHFEVRAAFVSLPPELERRITQFCFRTQLRRRRTALPS